MSFVIQKVVGRQISLSEIRADALRIGRGTNAELRSDNPAVALEHAVIALDSAGYTITDKGSITGTYVNGKPVETARLAKGDVIEIGDLKVDVQVADPAKPLFLRIVTKAKRNVSQAAPVIEEEEAPVVAAAGGGKPVRALRVDYAAAYRLHRTYLTKLSLIAFGLIAAFIAIAEVTKPEKQQAFMPGGLTSVHSRQLVDGQPIARKCDACHDPWKSVKDERCMVCHKRKVHSETEIGSPPCMKCHTEHRGQAILAQVSEATCATCHADLPAHMSAEARQAANSSDPKYPFAVLRKITAFGVDHPAIVAPADPDNLRFNHKLHLKATGVRNAGGRKEVLECLGCHAMVVSGKKSDPVALNFEKHCQRCHLLTFDPDLPKEQVPHVGDPQLVYGFITSTLAGNRDILGKSPDQVRRLLSQRAVVTPDARAFYAAEVVVKDKCGKCHELKKVNNRWVAQAPVILTSWFPGSAFTHTPEQHRGAGCENCHKGVRESARTSAVLMPKMEACVTCHGPGQSIRVSGCKTCHEYHVRSRSLLASATAAASTIRTTPPVSGENERMIDKILLIAIALLLVVVIVPIGIALYQRLKPRPDDRPAGGAPRPAPPPPPPLQSASAAPPPPAPVPPSVAPAPVAPAVAAVPESDRTRFAAPGEKAGGGKTSGTEFVQWNGMLLCTAGPLEGQRFVIEEEGFYIGRDAQLSQVVVNDSRVSKRHVRVMPRDGKVVAIDQGSTNGTFLGTATGQRITEVQLKRGDVLVLADNAATFVYQI